MAQPWIPLIFAVCQFPPIRRGVAFIVLAAKVEATVDVVPSTGEIVALYEADADEVRWRGALGHLSRRLDVSGLALLVDGQGGEAAVASGVPALVIEALRRWLSALAPTASETQSTWRRSGDLAWLMTDGADVERLMGGHCVVRLENHGMHVGYADLYREHGTPGFSAAALESFFTLAPHLAAALALAVRLAAKEAAVQRCAQCADMRPFGCLQLDDHGSVVELNRDAAEMLSTGDGLRIVDGRLRALRTADDAVLAQRISEAFSHDASPGREFVCVARPSGRRPYVLFVIRAETPQSVFARRLPQLRLVIVDSDRDKLVPREVLRAVYGLSESESRVAWQLASGDSLEQVAARLGIAQSTVRHHLERIFAKTGAHRQSDLVRHLHAPFVFIGSAQ